jgi:hypothetical protein
LLAGNGERRAKGGLGSRPVWVGSRHCKSPGNRMIQHAGQTRINAPAKPSLRITGFFARLR